MTLTVNKSQLPAGMRMEDVVCQERQAGEQPHAVTEPALAPPPKQAGAGGVKQEDSGNGGSAAAAGSRILAQQQQQHSRRCVLA
jgi:hypothetical protein